MPASAGSLGGVPAALVRRRADTLVARERGPPACLAGEDDALADFAADTDGAADLGAIPAFAGRGAAAARVERLLRVDALVCAFARAWVSLCSRQAFEVQS